MEVHTVCTPPIIAHKHGVADIASLLGVFRHSLLLSGVFYYCILWTVINSCSDNHSTGRQPADVPAMKSDRLNFANINLLILKFPNWFEIIYIARDCTKNFQMIRSWSQIPPFGYREVEVLRKRARAAKGHVRSQGIFDLQMYNEESQKVFHSFFDYVYIYDHILMRVST